MARKLQALFLELRRRRVFRTAALYIIGAWVLLQVTDLAFPAFGIPEAALRYVFAAVFLGFPLALIFGWMFDVSTQGIIRTPSVSEAIPDSTNYALKTTDYVVLVLLVGVLGMIAYGTTVKVIQEPADNDSQLALTAAGLFPDRTIIAVMPFENLGPAEDDYFAAGMTEEISTRLDAVRDLVVIATDSTRQYAGSDKTARQIGQELGATYLVMGSVRWSGQATSSARIRVTPKVIDAAKGVQIWADSFDRDFVDVFEIQSGIANSVVNLLDVTMLEPERRVLENRPTENFDAYKAYLKAQDWIRERISEETQSHSIEHLQRAITLDPEFVEAWLALGTAHSRMYSFRYDHSDNRRMLASRAMGRVDDLAPGSALSHLAKGIFAYHVERDYATAGDEFRSWKRLTPGTNSDDLTWFPALLERQGRFREAAAEYRQTTALDPRSTYRWNRLGQTYMLLNEFEEAIQCFEIAIELDPDYFTPHVNIAYVLWLRDGETEGARAVFSQAPDVPVASSSKGLLFWQKIFEEDYDGSLQYLAGLPDSVLSMPIFFRPKSLYEGIAHSLLGNEDAARISFEAAARYLEKELESSPNNEKLHSALGVAYGALGRTDDAIREGQRAVELIPLDREPWFGLVHVEDLAWIYTLVGAGR